VHVLESLDADAIRGWSVAAVTSLDAHRAEIDDLNVFPVPDGDTGTNMAATLRAGADALAAADAATVGDALAALARGAIIEARGNSGVIVAQLLNGMATAAAGADRYCTAELRRGLAEGCPRRTTRSPSRSRAPSSPWRGPRPNTCPRATCRSSTRSPPRSLPPTPHWCTPGIS
jgi:hypothetical protein